MNLRDGISSSEVVRINGIDVLASSVDKSISGVVEVSYYNGETLFTDKTIRKNDLLVGGAVYLMEKANNVRSGFVLSGLDEKLGISQASDVVRTVDTLMKEAVIGIIVGIGGCGDTRNTIKSVLKHHDVVPNWIPMRVVTTRLTQEERLKYIMEQFDGTYYRYWGKRFDAVQTVKVMYENGVEVSSNVSTIIDPGPINVYADMKAVVGAKDIREHFLLEDGNTLNSRINTMGLITGYADNSTGETIYRNIRCMTTLNMENKDLKDDLSTVSFAYEHHMKG